MDKVYLWIIRWFINN